MKNPSRIKLKDFDKEPFRVFFPAGVLAGIIGVALWPLYFWGVTEFYPGQIHARIKPERVLDDFLRRRFLAVERREKALDDDRSLPRLE